MTTGSPTTPHTEPASPIAIQTAWEEWVNEPNTLPVLPGPPPLPTTGRPAKAPPPPPKAGAPPRVLPWHPHQPPPKAAPPTPLTTRQLDLQRRLTEHLPTVNVNPGVRPGVPQSPHLPQHNFTAQLSPDLRGALHIYGDPVRPVDAHLPVDYTAALVPPGSPGLWPLTIGQPVQPQINFHTGQPTDWPPVGDWPVVGPQTVIHPASPQWHEFPTFGPVAPLASWHIQQLAQQAWEAGQRGRAERGPAVRNHEDIARIVAAFARGLSGVSPVGAAYDSYEAWQAAYPDTPYADRTAYD